MGFKVEQDCPQCGAPIQLDETDHLLRCSYCQVKSFLFTPNYFRFVLPHAAHGKEMIYAPYIRFKGNLYYCLDRTVGHRIVDITHLGLNYKGVPISLGVRPQAMKMKFLTPDTGGSFLRPTLKATDILARAGKIPSAASKGKLFHKAYIGETLSLIYLPLYLERGSLFDAVLNRPLADVPKDQDLIGQAANRNPIWEITFIPTLCPRCGWNLDGERDSVVLVCPNCETAWEASEDKFVQVSFQVVPDQKENTVFLPFWKISVEDKMGGVNSFADFIRFIGQPVVIEEQWEKQCMSFWSPAFKIRPKVFLNLSRQLTLSQGGFQTQEASPLKNFYPVTLPRTEAVQSIKTILAFSAINKKRVLPSLPRMNFRPKDSLLIYIPFSDRGHELVQNRMRLGINKNTLEFGRQL